MFYTHIEAAARGQTSANQEERLSPETNPEALTRNQLDLGLTPEL